MQITVTIGDILEQPADVLVSTANPWLNMSGGVNGAIRQRCPEIADELHGLLHQMGKSAVPAGTVVQTSAGTLPFDAILHAVAIDPFYDSSVELVASTVGTVFEKASALLAQTICLPALATGYGPLTAEQFAQALVLSEKSWATIREVFVVVRTEDAAQQIRATLRANRRSDP